MTTNRLVQIATACVVVLIATQAQAAFRTIQATEIVTIAPSDGSKAPHILVKWNLPSDLEHMEIDGAGIRITLSTTGEGTLPVEIHRVTETWSANTVSWASAWAKGGSNIDSKELSPGLITEANGGTVKLDVSEAVKDHITGKSSNFGFIIIPRAGEDRETSALTANDAAALAKAELVVAFRKKR